MFGYFYFYIHLHSKYIQPKTLRAQKIYKVWVSYPYPIITDSLTASFIKKAFLGMLMAFTYRIHIINNMGYIISYCITKLKIFIFCSHFVLYFINYYLHKLNTLSCTGIKRTKDSHNSKLSVLPVLWFILYHRILNIHTLYEETKLNTAMPDYDPSSSIQLHFLLC